MHALWDGGTSERGGHGATPGLAPGEAGGEDAPSLSLPRQVWSAGGLGWRTREPPPGLATKQLLPGRDVPGASAAAGGPEPGRGWAGGTYLPRDIPAPGVSGSQGAPGKGSPSPACVPGRSQARRKIQGNKEPLCFGGGSAGQAVRGIRGPAEAGSPRDGHGHLQPTCGRAGPGPGRGAASPRPWLWPRRKRGRGR